MIALVIVPVIVGFVGLVVVLANKWRNRERTTVSITNGTVATGPQQWGLAVVSISHFGRQRAIADIQIAWDDERGAPDGFGFGPVSAIDLGLPAGASLPTEAADRFKWAPPHGSSDPLTHGTHRSYTFKLYAHDPTWGCGQDDERRRNSTTRVMAVVTMAGLKRPFQSESAEVVVTPLQYTVIPPGSSVTH